MHIRTHLSIYRYIQLPHSLSPCTFFYAPTSIYLNVYKGALKEGLGGDAEHLSKQTRVSGGHTHARTHTNTHTHI